MDIFLPVWNPIIVHPLEWCLRTIVGPLQTVFPNNPGVAGALAIIIFTLALRLVLLPLTLIQIRSQRTQLAIQPELKRLQALHKGNREGMARAQMDLYKERGVNPMAGCFPLVLQLPVLFGMYSALSQIATQGLTLDQVIANTNTPGLVSYQAQRTDPPLPTNQFPLAVITVVPSGDTPVVLNVDQSQSYVRYQGQDVLDSTQSLTLQAGKSTPNNNPQNPASGKASIYLRPAGTIMSSGDYDRGVTVQAGQPYLVEVMVDAPQPLNVDAAGASVTYDPSTGTVSDVATPPEQLSDIPFKSAFLWLPSLGQPDVIRGLGTIAIPGALLILMTISSFLSQRVATMPSQDPQQQAMMKSMAFMPLMYLFFFLNTPAGLVIYWLTSNIFTVGQQYFTIGLGLLGGDLYRITGRDFQPPWAHRYAPALGITDDSKDGDRKGALVGAGAANARRNGGAANGASSNNNNNGTTPAGSRGGHGVDPSRDRPTPGKGRKRGKR